MATIEDFPSDDALLWYLAGVFDGEGCVTASIGKNGRAAIHCKVAMTDLETVKLFQDRFPSYVLSEKPRCEKYSTLYRWAVSGKPSLTFLRAMSTRCGLKRPAILLAIQYFEGLTHGSVSQALKQERLELLIGIRSKITRTNAKPIPEENIVTYLNREAVGHPRVVFDGNGTLFKSRTEAAKHYGTTPQCISSAITHGSVCCGTKWYNEAPL